MKSKKDANVKRPNAKKNIANVITQVKLVEYFVNVKVVLIAEKNIKNNNQQSQKDIE